MTVKHLHILARSDGRLSGDTRELSPQDVTAAFDGTPYGSVDSLQAVIDGQVDRGYAMPPSGDGWVAVARCSGASQDECADTLTRVVVHADLLAARQAGAL